MNLDELDLDIYLNPRDFDLVFEFGGHDLDLYLNRSEFELDLESGGLDLDLYFELKGF